MPTGSCLCGAVRYEVDFPSFGCSHCHCSICRRAHMAAYATWFGVAPEQFRLVAGESLERYRSSDTATRAFCRICGSTLFLETDQLAIALASLHCELDRASSGHVFYDDRAPWATVGDRLPRRGGADGMTLLPPEIAMPDPRVRFARPADTEALVRLQSELAAAEWDAVPEDMAADITRFFHTAHGDSFILVAEHEGVPAGLAVLHTFPAVGEAARQLVLDDLYVEPKARRHGLGSALVAGTLALARALGVIIVHLSTRTDNGPARRLYERHGFRASSEVLYTWEPEKERTGTIGS